MGFKDNNNVDIVINFLRENGISIGEEVEALSSYIDSGSFGDVYKIEGKNKVIKIFMYDEYSSKDEKVKKIEKYSKIKKFDYVVNIFFNRAIHRIDDIEFDNPVYITVMEYLERPNIPPLIHFSSFISHFEDEYYMNYSKDYSNIEKNFKEIRDNILNDESFNLSDTPSNMRRVKNKEEVVDKIKDIARIYKKDKQVLNIVFKCINEYLLNAVRFTVLDTIQILDLLIEYPNYIIDIFNGLRELESIGIRHEDLHYGNVLWDPKQKNYKLIDPI